MNRTFVDAAYDPLSLTFAALSRGRIQTVLWTLCRDVTLRGEIKLCVLLHGRPCVITPVAEAARSLYDAGVQGSVANVRGLSPV